MIDLNPQTALVLFSGGQDSCTALIWALNTYETVHTVGFHYGQRHNVEMEVRQDFLQKLRKQYPDLSSHLGEDHIINLQGLSEIGETAMTSEIEIVMDENGLPNTFVPGRNLAFFVMAGALAYRLNAGILVGGMCETDYSGYPDCRSDTLDTLNQAINLGMESNLKFETPLMQITKGDSWRLLEKLGGKDIVSFVNQGSHTCYKGVRETLHDWGYGCGKCPACELRARGWYDYSTQ